MLSFKAFLKEDKKIGTVTFNITFKTNNQSAKDLAKFKDKWVKEIKETIKSKHNLDYEWVDIMLNHTSNEIEVYFSQLTEELASYNNLVKVYNRVSEIIHFSTYTIVLFSNWGYPPFKLDWINVNIHCSDMTSLKDIDKFIGSNVDLVEFFTLGNITSSVLSLLKIKCKVDLFSVDMPAWCKIVKKHLVDKNILKCQKELIENGLKDFAK